MSIIGKVKEFIGKVKEETVERKVAPKIATYQFKSHGASRRIHRRAAHELLNGNPLPANKLATELNKRNSVINCGKTLRRKMTAKLASGK